MSHHKGQPSRTTGMAKPNKPKREAGRVHCVICEKRFMQMSVTDECCSPKCYKVLGEKRKVLGKENDMKRENVAKRLNEKVLKGRGKGQAPEVETAPTTTSNCVVCEKEFTPRREGHVTCGAKACNVKRNARIIKEKTEAWNEDHKGLDIPRQNTLTREQYNYAKSRRDDKDDWWEIARSMEVVFGVYRHGKSLMNAVGKAKTLGKFDRDPENGEPEVEGPEPQVKDWWAKLQFIHERRTRKNPVSFRMMKEPFNTKFRTQIGTTAINSFYNAWKHLIEDAEKPQQEAVESTKEPKGAVTPDSVRNARKGPNTAPSGGKEKNEVLARAETILSMYEMVEELLGMENEVSVGITDELEACNLAIMKEQMRTLKTIKKESLGGD